MRKFPIFSETDISQKEMSSSIIFLKSQVYLHLEQNPSQKMLLFEKEKGINDLVI